jgi:putative transcriptional regulator
MKSDMIDRKGPFSKSSRLYKLPDRPPHAEDRRRARRDLPGEACRRRRPRRTALRKGDLLNSLSGQLLIAMPQMQDHRFQRSVVYLCAHNEEGAMGLVINRLVGTLSMAELLEQLNIPAADLVGAPPVHLGGPVETGRGFVLHSNDYTEESSLAVGDGLALTATLDILRAMGRGQGPRRSLLALGYAGWGAGQLDNELQHNGWLHVPADEELIFDGDLDGKWQRALAKLGVDLSMLSADAGHA